MRCDAREFDDPSVITRGTKWWRDRLPLHEARTWLERESRVVRVTRYPDMRGQSGVRLRDGSRGGDRRAPAQ